jgi:DNA-binding transcriptional LysR family regulator
VAVIESGSFTGAAAALGLTQSAVSHALASLEDELGVTLVERERHGVSLTESGQHILGHTRDVLLHTEAIRQVAAGVRGLAAGKVRVGSFPSASAHLLPGIIRAFQQRYPGIEVVVFEGTDAEVREWILARVVDAGFVTLPTESVQAVSIAQDEMVVVVSTQHPLHTHRAVQVAQLATEPFIMSKAGCEPLIRAIFREAHVPLRPPQFEVSDVPTMLAMVQEGLGVTIVPRLNLVAHLTGIHTVSLDPPVFRRLALGVRTLEQAAPAVRAFLHQAQTWARAHGYFQEERTGGLHSKESKRNYHG